MADDKNYENSQSLSPDAEIVLYELTTRTGASVFFKTGPEIEYLGDLYESVPCTMSAEKKSADTGAERPTLSLGGDDLDLTKLKPALFSGTVDGGTVLKHIVQLRDLTGNVNQKTTSQYRIKQVKDYNKFKISFILARFSTSGQTTIPHVKYMRPAFPHVNI